MIPLETANFYSALGTLVLQIIGITFLALFFLRKKFPDLSPIAVFLETWGLCIGLLITLGGITLSLFYSEILGVLPCGLCWLQRIFLFPQAVLFALALWKRDKSIADYIIALSIFGAAVGLYQHYIQMGGSDILPCPATAATADCAQRFLFEFGYITFPLASFTVFAFLLIVMLFVRRASRIQ